MVLNPIFLIFEISCKSEIPFIREARIRGTAISFNKLMNIVPNGFIQSITNSLPPSIEFIINPKMIPKTIPIKIFQCSANCFIKSLRFSINCKLKKI